MKKRCYTFQIMTGMTLDKKSNIKEINRLINVAIAEGVVHYVRNALKNTSLAWICIHWTVPIMQYDFFECHTNEHQNWSDYIWMLFQMCARLLRMLTLFFREKETRWWELVNYWFDFRHVHSLGINSNTSISLEF